MKHSKFILCSIPVMVLMVILWPDQTPTQPSIETPPDLQKTDTLVGVQNLPTIRTPNIKRASEDTIPENWDTEGVRLQMVDVSEAYQENIRYPKYSKPLHKNDWNLLNPRAFIPTSTTLDFNEGLSAAIVLSKYIVSRDDHLNVSVHVTGEALNSLRPEYVSVYLSNKGQHSKAISLNSVVAAEGQLTYSGIVDKSVFSEIKNTEVMLIAELSFNNDEQAKVSAVFKLMGNEATLTTINDSYVEGSHLIVPASFDVLNPGYYRFEANLFDQTSKEPISHLNSSFLLTKSENTGLLKIHASTLRSKGYAGPYTLTDFNITRRPEKPGDTTGYGRSKEDSYTVKGFDLSFYSQEEYVDPKNQQRLEFLQKMAGIK